MTDDTVVTQDRVTVVEKVYHQTAGEEPFAVENTFSRNLKTQEQPYSRRCTATEEWQPLDCGWLKGNVGMLIISNLAGTGLTTIPSGDERAEIEKQVLEICDEDCVDGAWLIPPGEAMRGIPKDASRLCVRCQSGSIKYKLSLIPS